MFKDKLEDLNNFYQLNKFVENLRVQEYDTKQQ